MSKEFKDIINDFEDIINAFNDNSDDLYSETYKYNEDEILDEVREYIRKTYSQHYTNGGVTLMDLICGLGDVIPFCRSSALKYVYRFGNKQGNNLNDILKAIHYLVLLYYFVSKKGDK